MIEGTVEIARAGQTQWSPGILNQTLFAGDRVRTGEHSRAEIYLAGGMSIKKGEFSEVQIPPSEGPTFRRGIFEVFHRDRNRNAGYSLPGATAAVRGTDFLVKVDDNGNSELTVLDGVVVLKNASGEIELHNRERGIVDSSGGLRKTAVLEPDNDLIQWSLYYPAVVDPDELNFTDAEKRELNDSLRAYRAGDLLAAVAACAWSKPPSSDAERVYRAALLLSVGEVEKSRQLLHSSSEMPAAKALEQMIAVVKGESWKDAGKPATASQWVAQSYALQYSNDLGGALAAARAATTNAPDFGFAWERAAELEFSFGRVGEATQALDKALRLSPRNAQALALKGFLLAAENKIPAALGWFDRAIAADSALANAWLGHGLCRIHEGHTADGLRELLIAASLEPQRGVLHSYLGKAFADSGDDTRAAKELLLARHIDPNDPTSWLYFALLEREENRINESIADLEHSQALNDNRSLFRSRLLLDQDQAVRSASLAEIYQDAGLQEMSLNEATRAVNEDYANFSAHQFLAESYNLLSDPNLVNLRYETATFSEYLVANLLAPVGAGTLSQNVSQQEYSKLFERDRFGASITTTYVSEGDWRQEITQYATEGNTAYSLDGIYRSFNGAYRNNDLQQYVFSGQIKQQLTPRDSIYFQSIYNHLYTGDVRQYYNPANSSPTLRDTEVQAPDLFIGYNHEWSPGVHTLLLAGRLSDRQNFHDTNIYVTTFATDGAGNIIQQLPSGTTGLFGLGYVNDFEAYTAEFQQIVETGQNTVIAGARFQTGQSMTSSQLNNKPAFFALFSPQYNENVTTTLERFNAYCYDNWQILNSLQLSAGVSYDHLRFPENIDSAPVSGTEQVKTQVSPKAGFTWTPDNVTRFRAAYTRSIGGLFYDQSVRLEPTQVAGFNQAFRSLIPESVAGDIPGSKFETYSIGFDRKFETRTYLVVEADLYKSKASSETGSFNLLNGLPTGMPGQTPQDFDFEEKTLSISLNQLIDNEWSVGSRYRLSQDKLSTAFSYPSSAIPVANNRAILSQLNFFVIYNHPSGFFAEAESLWWAQHNYGYSPVLPGDYFWQIDLLTGFRFPHRRGEIDIGIYNLGNQDYNLNPLNLYDELPRQRTLAATFTANF